MNQPKENFTYGQAKVGRNSRHGQLASYSPVAIHPEGRGGSTLENTIDLE
jgi:hypothetical protein